MGLDMFAYRTKEPVQINHLPILETEGLIFYWKNHDKLHEWMLHRNLFKHGVEPGRFDEQYFNTWHLQLSEQDIDALEAEILYYRDRGCSVYDGEDLDFIKSARDVLAAGECVFYVGWW